MSTTNLHSSQSCLKRIITLCVFTLLSSYFILSQTQVLCGWRSCKHLYVLIKISENYKKTHVSTLWTIPVRSGIYREGI